MDNDKIQRFYRRIDSDLLIAKKYSNNFAKISLVQQVNEDPVVFKGSGSIYQDESGALVLKVFHLYTEDHRERSFLEKVAPGVFIGNKHFFRLSATDMSGKEWFANNVRITVSLKLPSVGTVIESPIDEIETAITSDSKNEFDIELIAIGKYETPPSDFLKYPDGSKRRTKHVINHDLFEITTISNEDCLYVRITGKSDQYNEHICDLVVEAIGVAVGIKIAISTISTSVFDKVSYKIKSGSFRGLKSVLPPIPTYRPKDGDNFTDFVTKYINVYQKPLSVFYMNWSKIHNAAEHLLDNTALIQSTAIEGVLKEYFKVYGKPHGDEKASIDKAIESVNVSGIDDDMKKRIVDVISNLKGQNSRKALKDLNEAGKITAVMYNAWKKRNELAHGGIVSAGGQEEQQKALDDTLAVLTLFYRLLLIHIGYGKKYYDYSQRGHPELVMP